VLLWPETRFLSRLAPRVAQEDARTAVMTARALWPSGVSVPLLPSRNCPFCFQANLLLAGLLPGARARSARLQRPQKGRAELGWRAPAEGRSGSEVGEPSAPKSRTSTGPRAGAFAHPALSLPLLLLAAQRFFPVTIPPSGY